MAGTSVMKELKNLFLTSHNILEKSNKQILLIYCIFALLGPKMSQSLIIQSLLFINAYIRYNVRKT